MQNNAKVGGILSIVAGVFGVLGLFVCIIVAVVALAMHGDFYYRYSGPMTGAELSTIIAVVYIIMGIFYAILGALAITGGVLALQKKYWGWALAGAIGGTMAFCLCGIPAIIFIALGKKEFQGAAPPAPSAPMEKIVG